MGSFHEFWKRKVRTKPKIPKNFCLNPRYGHTQNKPGSCVTTSHPPSEPIAHTLAVSTHDKSPEPHPANPSQRLVYGLAFGFRTPRSRVSETYGLDSFFPMLPYLQTVLDHHAHFAFVEVK